MKLSRPFYRLPVRFDVERLRAEVAAVPPAAWAPHPGGMPGNSALRLISVGGGENDDVNGRMQATAHLAAMPYVRQVLASFGVVWSRSRLMRLAPGAEVTEHADINYHWYFRVRIHIPVFTQPDVLFHCDGETVHMAAGEAWVFDNWRLHSVVNPGRNERIHLVADTSGSAAFWQFVAQSLLADAPLREHRFAADQDAPLLLERTALAPVMAPAEIDLLVMDLRSELQGSEDSAATRTRLGQYHALLDAFCRDWRQLYALHGAAEQGWPEYERLRGALRQASRELGEGLRMRSNRIPAHKVLEARVLRAALPAVPDSPQPDPPRGTARPATPDPAQQRPPGGYLHALRRPIFIIAAPRSGSTLLFETLAASDQFCTVGGEAHWLVEDIPQLRPGAPGVDSNRLTAAHASPEIARRLLDSLEGRLLKWDRSPVARDSTLCFLEKTPKNALRIPFLATIFPEARFLFLWREPRGNLGSIIDAWGAAGRWKTYNGLPGFAGPWSLLLPPGWEAMSGKPVEDIAAFQWEAANRIALDDLMQLPAGRWMALQYEAFLADPAASVARICAFAGLEVDAGLRARVARPLPLSRQTNTPPDPGKWRRHTDAIERVLPRITPLWERLQRLEGNQPKL